jgi:Ni,Fe-hydrogenase III large subunit
MTGVFSTRLRQGRLDHSVVRERFTGTAVLTPAQATDLGTLAYVARASGLTTDARYAGNDL